MGRAASYLAYFAFVLVFPTGTLPGGRWRRPAIAMLAIGVLSVVLTAIAPTLSFNIDGSGASIRVPNRLALLPGLNLWLLFPADGRLLGVGRLRTALVATTDTAVRPIAAGVWLRPAGGGK